MPFTIEQDEISTLQGNGPVRSARPAFARSAEVSADARGGFLPTNIGSFPDLEATASSATETPKVHSRDLVDGVRDAAVSFRQSDSEKLEVRIRADHHTAVLVEFARREGRVEAAVHIQSGNSDALQQHWTELRRVFREQGITLLDPGLDLNSGSRGGSQSDPHQTASRDVREFSFENVARKATPRPVRFSGRTQHRLLESWA